MGSLWDATVQAWLFYKVLGIIYCRWIRWATTSQCISHSGPKTFSGEMFTWVGGLQQSGLFMDHSYTGLAGSQTSCFNHD